MNNLKNKQSHLNEDRLFEKIENVLHLENGESHEAPIDELSKRRLFDDLIDRSSKCGTEKEEMTKDVSRRTVLLVCSLAATILLCAGAVLWMQNRASPTGPMAPAEVAVNELDIVITAGSARIVEAHQVEPRTSVQAQDLIFGNNGALVSIGEHVTLLMDQNSHLQIEKKQTDHVLLNLKNGALLAHVSPTKGRPILSIATEAGKLTVTGTVFSVYAQNNQTKVEVFRGSVRLVAGNKTQNLAAHRVSIMGDDTIENIDQSRLQNVLKTVYKLSDLSNSDNPQAFISLDLDSIFGRLPDEPTVSIASTTNETRTFGIERDEPKTIKVKEPKNQDSVSSRELLRQARTAKKERNWENAAYLYQKLLKKFPHSAEAEVSLVSLGSIELNHLGKPNQALKHFKNYLKTAGAGPLATEASWGIAKALKQMGQTSKEKAALIKFIENHPGAFQVQQARDRLTQLK